jgi:hypothetical protein
MYVKFIIEQFVNYEKNNDLEGKNLNFISDSKIFQLNNNRIE